MSPPRRPRGWLTEEDLRVWTEVARTAKPLRGKAQPKVPALPGKSPNPMSNSNNDMAPRGGDATRVKAVAGARQGLRHDMPSAPPLAALERRFVKGLRRGTAAPGAIIDLHGLRQEEARGRLSVFLRRCQAEGTKAAIVITGKGGRGARLAAEPGVLRRAVPIWLAMPELRSLVVGYEEAGAGLGGAGALIVRVRASRRGPRA